MRQDEPAPQSRIAALRTRVGARAAGWWRVAPDRLSLVQVAFSAADDMPAEVARGFAAATLSVPVSAGELGIVRAAVTGGVAVSRADSLPPDSGSGLWLRKFGASRSVAVPVPDGPGLVRAVVSIALDESGPDDTAAARAVRDAAASWPLD